VSAVSASPAAKGSPAVPGDPVRALQHALYRAAKADPGRRFHALYDKVSRSDVLWRAWVAVRRNNGAPGIDKITLAQVEEYGVARLLGELASELREGRYRPLPARRVFIPKPGTTGQRPLSIPPVRDRIVQAAVKIVLEPVFEADFLPCSFGFRPRRSAHDALQVLIDECWRGRRWVVETDIASCFSAISHEKLMQAVEERVCDRSVLKLLRVMLRAGAMEDGQVRRPVTGTPQGGVISPLLANRYMNRFLRHWRYQERGKAFRAHVVNYADDFVILSRGHADEALTWTRRVMTRLGLTVNEAKTTVRNARQERFDFLGYSFGPHHYRKDGHWYLGASPSRRSVQRLKARVAETLVPSNVAPWEEVRDRLNHLLRGWATYFSHGTRLMAYRAADNHVYATVRGFLTRRHKVPSRGTRRFSDHVVFGELGVLRLRRMHIGAPPIAER